MAPSWPHWLTIFLSWTLALSDHITTLSSTDLLSGDNAFSVSVPCFQPAPAGSECYPQRCSRHLIDSLFEDTDIDALLAIVEKGLALSPATQTSGGPSIFDLNTGFVRTPAGMENIFARKHENVFSPKEFEQYGKIIKKLKGILQERLDTTMLFTSPSFVTRLSHAPEWQPAAMHDEYWHMHVDQNSTAHYTYSGLLYLSTYGVEFTGGRLFFYGKDEVTVEQIVEPRRGRVAIFTSGPENPHNVEKLTSGNRYTLSFWFTCDAKREFEIFLDGNAHQTFGKKFVENLQRRHREKEL